MSEYSLSLRRSGRAATTRKPKDSAASGPSEPGRAAARSREDREDREAAKKRRSRDKRDRILKAAVKVFARNGFHATRVSEVAKAAGVEVKVEFGPAIEPALRNHAANPSTYSGAVMHRIGTSRGCTTGWRMTQISGSVPVMASAHHCFEGVEGDAWGYTTIAGYPTANAYSIYGAGMSAGDVAVWKGALADQMLPGIFIGDHTVSGSGVLSQGCGDKHGERHCLLLR